MPRPRADSPLQSIYRRRRSEVRAGTCMSIVVVALGGNALNRPGGNGGWAEAVAQMRRTAPALVELVAEGHEVVLTHGNGPQIGALLREAELSEREVPARPMDALGAETQGQIGYLIQQELETALAAARVPRVVVPIVSRMEVSSRDPAFRHPTKPVGRFYSESEARVLRKRQGWEMAYDAHRSSWRRVVPSPRPLRWLEGAAVRGMLRTRSAAPPLFVVAGGGGVPVVRRRRSTFEGVEAVIDKDLSAALVAHEVGADTLAVVTDVPAAAVGFGKPWEKWLGRVTLTELERYHRAGEFGEGSMGPKVEAGLEFLRAGGRRFVITDAPSLHRAMRDEAGTRVTVG